MKVIIEIDMGNAAFDNNPFGVLAETLRKTADRVDNGSTNHYILDENGNRIGYIKQEG